MITVLSWYYKSGKQGFEVWLMGKSQIAVAVQLTAVYSGQEGMVGALILGCVTTALRPCVCATVPGGIRCA